MIEPLFPPDAPPVIGPFAHGVLASGKLLFVSGQGPQDPVSGKIELGSFEFEARRTLENVERVLRAGGADWSKVARVQVYLTDADRFTEFNAIYASVVGDARPARTTIICNLLAGIQIEIDCVAALG
jgi:2-iminobutanoate/2-iminopropanoate deaminase